MLNYQSMSFHDVATLLQTFGKTPAPEYLAWLEKWAFTKMVVFQLELAIYRYLKGR